MSLFLVSAQVNYHKLGVQATEFHQHLTALEAVQDHGVSRVGSFCAPEGDCSMLPPRLPASLASLAYRSITPDCLVLHMEFSFVHTCVQISSLYNDTIYTGLTSLGKLTSQTVKNLPAMRETWIGSLGQEDPLEQEMATHSSILA